MGKRADIGATLLGSMGGELQDFVESTVTLTDDNTLTGTLDNTYLDFLSGYIGNLTAASKSIADAAIDAAGAAGGGGAVAMGNATVSASAVNSILGTSDAVGGVFLPTCTKGTHLAILVDGDMDAANAVTFHASGSSAESTSATTFAYQVVGPMMGDASATAQTVKTGGAHDSPASTKLIYTPAAAATNFLQVGSIIHFYAPVTDQWLVRVYNVKEGAGSTGTFTVG